MVCGIYPITPQTEIVEYVARFPFSKGRVIPVESEHSAMGVCIGAALNGARAFTASSSNGLAYMAENIMVAAFYRLPIVMAAVNRTLGPPWNIWADQGDTLMFRDFGWVQLYCDSNQDVADTTLLAFRLAEDPRILLPVMVCMDAFIVSHTSMEIELATQQQVDRFLPPCEVPQRLDSALPVTIGGMTFPQETLSQRLDLDEALRRVPAALEEHRRQFREVFGRDVERCCGSLSLRGRRSDPHRLRDGCEHPSRRGRCLACPGRAGRHDPHQDVSAVPARRNSDTVLRSGKSRCTRPQLRGRSRRYFLPRSSSQSAGSGKHFRAGAMVQSYLTGVGGGDVVPATVHEVVDDLTRRPASGEPVWKGIEA